MLTLHLVVLGSDPRFESVCYCSVNNALWHAVRLESPQPYYACGHYSLQDCFLNFCLKVMLCTVQIIHRTAK